MSPCLLKKEVYIFPSRHRLFSSVVQDSIIHSTSRSDTDEQEGRQFYLESRISIFVGFCVCIRVEEAEEYSSASGIFPKPHVVDILMDPGICGILKYLEVELDWKPLESVVGAGGLRFPTDWTAHDEMLNLILVVLVAMGSVQERRSDI